MPPRCLGLTGGIGSGKSTALRAFARLGAGVLSSDELVHRLYREAATRDAVVGRFGAGVLDADGQIDRQALGDVAFADPEGIAALERLIHPLVGAARERWVAEQAACRPPPPLLVCEVPLLFEAGIADAFDAVLVVTASPDVRRRRVAARGQDFDERAGRQMDEAAKVAEADHAFVNDGSIAALEAWVGEVFRRYGAVRRSSRAAR